MDKLNGKIAIVLGAAGRDNMGQTIARRLARDGASVVVAGRDPGALKQLAEEIDGLHVVCDITSRQDLNHLVTYTTEQLGGLDIGVNCVGWGLFKPFLDTTDQELSQMIDIQFRGPFQFLQEVIPATRSGGSIVQISSITSEILLPDHAAYMGTKAGIDHVIRSVANDFGARGIRINSVSPAMTDTPMNAAAKAIPGFFDAFLPYYPLGRIGTMDDIAAAVAWLVSDECFMTGQTVRVDGGLSLRGLPPPERFHEISAGNARVP